MLLNTLAASLIWGVNTLFLLDAGLSNTEAFFANAFFTIGQVLFEIPTGVVADTRGRRTSYVLGTLTLSLSTALYLYAWYVQAPMWAWAGSSILLGLGFTFFSGATEAWLVDSLEYSGYKGSLDRVFGKGQMISGVAMLVGSVGGGVLAQMTNLGAPYVVRALLLLANFALAVLFMKDWGFEPKRTGRPLQDVRNLLSISIEFGWKNKPARWVMIAAPFLSGVGFYSFYAMQPYLLELYQNDRAYAIAGLAAAIVAGAQVAGGYLAPWVRTKFQRRTSVLLFASSIGIAMLFLIGFVQNFWIVIGLFTISGLLTAAAQPVRQAYLNSLIPSNQRATVLSFDSLLGSGGGVVIQPILGRVADVWSYALSFIVGAGIELLALPFYYLAKQENSKADDG